MESVRSYPPPISAFPDCRAGRLLHRLFRGLLGVYCTLRPARLAESPKATLYIRGSGSFVTSATAPIATGWSEPVPARDFQPAVDQRLYTAHRQLRARARSLTVLPAGLKFIKPGERNPAEGKSKIFLPWNEAQLNFVSLRSSLHYVGVGQAVKGRDERPKNGRPRQPAQPKGRSVSNF